MDEEQRPVEHETTIIQTGERRGGGGAVTALVALVVIALIAFVYFGGYLQKAADEVNVDVNVTAPNIDLPDIKVESPPPAAPAEPANSN